MDSDLQHFPEDIPEFLSVFCKGTISCAGGARSREGFRRRWPSWLANRVDPIWSLAFECTTLAQPFARIVRSVSQHIQLLGGSIGRTGAGSASRCKIARGQDTQYRTSRRQSNYAWGGPFTSYWTFCFCTSQIPFHEAAQRIWQVALALISVARLSPPHFLDTHGSRGYDRPRSRRLVPPSALLMLIGMQSS